MAYILTVPSFLLIGAVPALIFILLLWKRYLRLVPVLLLVLIVSGAAASVYLVYAGGFFGAGVLCLTVPVAAWAMVVLIGARATFFRLSKEDKLRRRWYLAGIFLIPFALLSPLIDEFLLVSTCDALNRQRGDTIVQALAAYKQDHGTYPEELEALVPTYIPALPSVRCFAPHQWFHQSDPDQEPSDMMMAIMWSLWNDAAFKLYQCPQEGVTLLIVPSVMFDAVERYNLTTGSGWSRTTLLDGTCSYLR